MNKHVEGNTVKEPRIRSVQSPILLIGVGNRYRSDDGVGFIIAEEIRKRNILSFDVKYHSGEGASLMEAWKGYQSVILIDAVSSGAIPGTIHIFNPVVERIPSKFFHYSTHAFSVAEAIEVARTLGALPDNMVMFGIEGKCFEMSERISPAVQHSIPIIVERLIFLISDAQGALLTPNDKQVSPLMPSSSSPLLHS